MGEEREMVVLHVNEGREWFRFGGAIDGLADTLHAIAREIR